MSSTKKRIALFANSRAVIRADEACRAAGLKTRIIPVPEAISSECGMSLLVPEEELEQFETLMQRDQIITEIHVI